MMFLTVVAESEDVTFTVMASLLGKVRSSAFNPV